jgi:hypothetical protein
MGHTRRVSSERARVAAGSVGAADLFVLRRVSAGRFVHFGGTGRGEGWAGIVEVAVEDEAPLAEALRTEQPVRLDHDGRELVFGPYYARAAAIVPVGPDTVVVFGATEQALDAGDGALEAAAREALDAVDAPGPAKGLADELELLEAVRAVCSTPTTPVEDAMRSVAGSAAEALSCELGAVYLADGDRLAVLERGWSLATSHDELRAALKAVLERREFPVCVQDAKSSPPPGALAEEAGIRSYYLLELTGAARGVLLVAHTDAAPRGFTLLCRALGARVADVASAVLGLGITREWIAAEAARLQTAFAELEG